jgi:hypothetical protein
MLMTDPQIETLPFKTRDATESDMPFVLGSFKASLYRSPVYNCFSKAVFYGWANRLDTLFNPNKARILIAEPDVEPDGQILAWCAGDSQGLLYIYTKQPFRNAGLATSMLPRATHYAFHGPQADWLQRHGMRYNPINTHF